MGRESEVDRGEKGSGEGRRGWRVEERQAQKERQARPRSRVPPLARPNRSPPGDPSSDQIRPRQEEKPSCSRRLNQARSGCTHEPDGLVEKGRAGDAISDVICRAKVIASDASNGGVLPSSRSPADLSQGECTAHGRATTLTEGYLDTARSLHCQRCHISWASTAFSSRSPRSVGSG